MESYTIDGTQLTVPMRYQIGEPLGQGAYGFVCSATDQYTGEAVAIKKVENVFDNLVVAKRTLRELKILRHLVHENLIQIQLAYHPGNKETYQDIYIVTDLMDTDLNKVLRSEQPLSDDHIKFFSYQMYRGLKFLHSADVIHRDLKPRNILVNSQCDLKICDYGLSRVRYPDEVFSTCPMTEYICTRWYRALEVLCCFTDFGKPVDIWSAACIFAEMLRRRPLFPGRGTEHQLQLLIGILGTPETDVLEMIPNQRIISYIELLPQCSSRLHEQVRQDNPDAFDLITKTLSLAPDNRLTASQCLEHKYFDGLHLEEDEPTRLPLDTADFEFERRKIDLNSMRQEIYIETLRYQPQRMAAYLEEEAAQPGGYNILDCRLLAPGETQYTSEEE